MPPHNRRLAAVIKLKLDWVRRLQAESYALSAVCIRQKALRSGQSHERQVRAFLPLQGGGQEGDGVEKQDYGSNFSADAPIPTPTLPLKGREHRSCDCPGTALFRSKSIVYPRPASAGL